MDRSEGRAGPVAHVNINPSQVLADTKFENLGGIRTEADAWNLQLVQEVSGIKVVANPILELFLKEHLDRRTETVFKRKKMVRTNDGRMLKAPPPPLIPRTYTFSVL